MAEKPSCTAGEPRKRPPEEGTADPGTILRGSSREIGSVVDVDPTDTELKDSRAEARAGGDLISPGFMGIWCLACQQRKNIQSRVDCVLTACPNDVLTGLCAGRRVGSPQQYKGTHIQFCDWPRVACTAVCQLPTLLITQSKPTFGVLFEYRPTRKSAWRQVHPKLDSCLSATKVASMHFLAFLSLANTLHFGRMRQCLRSAHHARGAPSGGAVLGSKRHRLGPRITSPLLLSRSWD